VRWKLSLFATAIFGLLALCYLFCFHYTEAYQIGIRWNWLTGELQSDTHSGLHFTPPWVQVARIDTRPVRVCITSASRGFSCKLVQFNPDEYKAFVAVQGFHYYWWANRFSFNSGYGEEYRGMKDIMRGYAYSSKQYPFITVLREYKDAP
jgi:hypothetical protein